MKPLAWAGQGAAAVKQVSDQSLHAVEEGIHAVEEGIAGVRDLIHAIWAWSSDQLLRLTQAPFESWPLWKQALFIIVAALVVGTLLVAARQLWWATLNVLSAVATFVGTLIMALPTIVLAAAIAMAGLWAINNFNLSSLRSVLHGSSSTTGNNPGSSPPSRPSVDEKRND
jgi:hypothetical protein